MHAFHSSKNISIPVIFDNIFLWKLSWIKGKRQNIYSSFLVCPRICFLPGLTRQSNWHKSNTKQQKGNIPILIIHWENYPIIQQSTEMVIFFIISFGTDFSLAQSCQLIFATSLIQFGWTKRPRELFCSALIVLTTLSAAESELMMFSSSMSSSLSLLHMTVVRVTQVTRRMHTRAIRRERITSDVRGEELLSSGAVTATTGGGWWQ